MKNSFWVLLLVCGFWSCTIKSGSGVIVEETRTVGDFHAIDIGQGMELVITEAPQPSVRVSADDNLIDFVITEVQDGELQIRFKDQVSLTDANIIVYVAGNGNISRIHSGSGSDVETEQPLHHDKGLELVASSGSKMDIDVDAPEVKVEVSSGSSAELKGFTRKLIGRAGSGSTLDAEDLKSEEADLSASSGSTIRGFASVALQAEASSGGSVRYSGPAELKVSKSESSGGSVQAHE